MNIKNRLQLFFILSASLMISIYVVLPIWIVNNVIINDSFTMDFKLSLVAYSAINLFEGIQNIIFTVVINVIQIASVTSGAIVVASEIFTLIVFVFAAIYCYKGIKIFFKGVYLNNLFNRNIKFNQNNSVINKISISQKQCKLNC